MLGAFERSLRQSSAANEERFGTIEHDVERLNERAERSEADQAALRRSLEELQRSLALPPQVPPAVA
eukprot:5623407-Lingulodinium_polyedra.AAC.1